MNYIFIKDKNKDQLLEELCGGSQPGSPIFEQLREAISIECAKEIVSAVDQLRTSNEHIATSNDSLGSKVFWLNVILTFATVIGAAATVVQAYPVFKNWIMPVTFFFSP